VLWGVCEALAQVPEPKVSSIEIRGVKRIEIPAIVGRLTLKASDPYTPETVRGQIKILYDTGFFEDVQVETESVTEGIAVTFIVQEKPFITEIVFDGNNHLSDDKLKEKTTIKSQTFLDQQLVKESAENMRQLYQHDGYYNAQVIPVIQTLDEDRKRLMFHITEGDKAKIKTVVFEGLRAATKAEMFTAMSTREWIPWYGFFTKLKLPSIVSDAGVLKRDELANDVERIKEVLLNKGYFNVRVGQPSVELIVGDLNSRSHVTQQFVFAVDDVHSPAPQDVGRTDHDGISDFLCKHHRLFRVGGRAVGRLPELEPLQQMLKPFAILRQVDGVRSRPDDWHAFRLQRSGQLQRRLPTELHDHSPRIFPVYDFEYVFQRQWLKIQAVRSVVIGRNGFGIAIDHDGLVAVFPER
jgi:hypothetical protein